jgi:hypothetical protein
MDNASKYESGSKMKKEDIDFVLEKLKVSRILLILITERGHGRSPRGTNEITCNRYVKTWPKLSD